MTPYQVWYGRRFINGDTQQAEYRWEDLGSFATRDEVQHALVKFHDDQREHIQEGDRVEICHPNEFPAR